MPEYVFSIWQSPFGWMGLAASELGMLAITSPRPTHRAAYLALCKMIGQGGQPRDNEHIRQTRAELELYFNQDPRVDFVRVTLDTTRGTPLARQVWQTLREIPRGETRSYEEIARAVGHPRAARAIGQCNTKNPWAIIVPCHRVIGKNATLTGYAGGIKMKRRLLELEGVDVTAFRATKHTTAQKRRLNAHRH